MPVTPTYPGVYIEEISSGVKTITPVATSITAFVGRAQRGPTNDPKVITSFAAFQRQFGGLSVDSTMSYAVQQYYLNGGSQAVIVRVADTETATKAQLDIGGLVLEASGEGSWGDDIRIRVDYDTKEPENPQMFNLHLYDPGSGALEEFRNLETNPDSGKYVELVLEEDSSLARVAEGTSVPEERPPADAAEADFQSANWFDDPNTGTAHKRMGDGNPGNDGADLGDEDLLGNELEKTGIYALEKADLFNLMCLPPPTRTSDIEESTLAAALAYCKRRRAMLIIDSPSSWKSIDQAVNGVDGLRGTLGSEDSTRNSALFFPRVKMADELKDNRLAEFVPCGAIAGIFSRTDVSRGVWKAPAGINAGFVGVDKFTVTMTDLENGRLNPIGVNCLRNFPVHGNVVWGSRTVAGADRLGSEWKYIPVRRFALFLEESLYRGTQWVVFEPNDQPLWDQIRVNIDTFMNDLFRQGAFQGVTPKQAYFVKCDSETTTQSDIDRGIVNIEVGFAPLKPAEFVILKIQQISGRKT